MHRLKHAVKITEDKKEAVKMDTECTKGMCRTWTLTAAHHILPKCGILLNHRQTSREERHKEGNRQLNCMEEADIERTIKQGRSPRDI